MFCENNFCIYEKDKQCILDNITLDIQGRCKECIYINVDEITLQKIKDNMLEKFESDYDF